MIDFTSTEPSTNLSEIYPQPDNAEYVEETYEYSYNEDLAWFRRDRRNIIIDSLRPDIPHIVITPPDHPYDGYWAYVTNATGPQDRNLLTIPPAVNVYGHVTAEPLSQDPHTSWHFTRLGRRSALELENAGTSSSSSPSLVDDVHVPHSCGQGHPVFSHERFHNSIETAAEERLFMYHVIPSLYKIHFKAAVFLACEIAPLFRKQWDIPEYAQTHERPYHWSDPAQPLLSLHSSLPGSLILDSTNPFKIPHIIIEEAPPENPWEASVNNTLDPQNFEFGNLLTVPSHHVRFVNYYERFSRFEYEDFEVENGDGDDDEDRFSESVCSDVVDNVDDDSGYSSVDDSHEIVTPTSQCEFHIYEVNGDGDQDKLWQSSITSSSTKPTFQSSQSGPDYHSIHPHGLPSSSTKPSSSQGNYSEASVSNYDLEDDEDDLPPFDDWYLSIATRSTSSSSTAAAADPSPSTIGETDNVVSFTTPHRLCAVA
ncbi:hypothetical protein C8Q75DRAFT_742700 [Abortiporus biennis]|nr:hypothetical protein C8Q75DRAFT_742700 [Abortiporus biennis]